MRSGSQHVTSGRQSMRSTLSFPPGTGRSRIGLGADPARSQNAKRIRINTRAGRCSGAKRWSARGTPPRFSTCPFVLDAGLERWEFDPHRRGRGTGVRPDARTRNRTGVACGENVFTFTLTVARLISGDRTATHWTQTLWLWLPLVILCQRACDCGCCHRRLTADWRLSSKWRCRASSLCRLALGAASGESGSSGPISCCMRCWCAALSASNFSRSRRV